MHGGDLHAVSAAKQVIGITIGDSAGIGPEVAAAALDSNKLDPFFDYRLIGEKSAASLGRPDAKSALAARAALEQAVSLALKGELAAVVTGPVSKARMHAIGFPFPGQTEFFAARCGVSDFAMLLTGGALTVALVTAHIPLREVAAQLRTAEIVRVGNLLTDYLLCRDIRAPRVAIAGLNPHAGESGALGNEESEIVAPGIETLRESWSGRASFEGPASPDTIFYRAARGEFDAVLCMYHDQGLIPLKLHAFDEGVNVTLGLPFPRTSPDHGTAFDIAGKGLARPHSMIAAINLAGRLIVAKSNAAAWSKGR
jgi:4-hydroxythreonine-4-phosphate dehydrogenase